MTMGGATVVAYMTGDGVHMFTLDPSVDATPNRVGMIANTGGPAIIAAGELIEGRMAMPP